MSLVSGNGDIGPKILKALGLPDEIVNNTRKFIITVEVNNIVHAAIEYFVETDSIECLEIVVKEYQLVDVTADDEEGETTG